MFSIISFATLLIETSAALITLATSYLLLFLYETKLVNQYRITNVKPDYLKMRFLLTVIVTTLHITAFIMCFTL
jgi:hypothetical protein